MAESKELAKQIAELYKEQTEEMLALERKYEVVLEVEKLDKLAVGLRNMYNSYIKVGFTEEQAWKMLEIFFDNGTKKEMF